MTDLARAHQNPHCWLANFTDTPCDGNLYRCHLISKQQLRKLWDSTEAALRRGEEVAPLPHATLGDLVADRRAWVWGCGGPMGNGGHHGMLDQSRTLRIPLDRIPIATIELARDLGLYSWLEREYGGARWSEARC